MVKRNDLTLKTLKRFNFKLRELIENSDRAANVAFQLRYFSLTEAVNKHSRTPNLESRILYHVTFARRLHYCRSSRRKRSQHRKYLAFVSANFLISYGVNKNKREKELFVRKMHWERFLYTDRGGLCSCVCGIAKRARSVFFFFSNEIWCVNLLEEKKIVNNFYGIRQ